LSKAQTIPFTVPEEETDGVLPGKPKLLGDCGTLAWPNMPVVVLKV
jgi:hypothetical protein